ncbi:MAG: mandelate racemase/muconate lactonizing enzyme family protein [Bryobacterales bacterium]|nr:mandelate racemase/muconate lactonizing enzyme family protein [Bryobacterales bacterium]
MKKAIERLVGRRDLFKAGAGAATAAFMGTADLEAYPQNTNTHSRPSELKITDMRMAWIKDAPMQVPILRLDTNQGISGWGEVRDGADKRYALMLKSRLLGENPCNIDKLFRKIKQFGGPARQAGGVCGVEMALWDLAGKAYNVPVYQMLGGKFREKIRLYADTPESPDPAVFAERLKRRMDHGFTFLKMDVGVRLVEGIPGTLSRPLGITSRELNQTQHMFTGMELTDKGIELMAEYVGRVRSVVGMEVPLAADHFGHIGLNSCIRLGKALEKHNLAWLEDMIPWQYADLWKEITDAVDIPTLTGEDIYLKEPFMELCRKHAVDMIHPDLASSGGILETKKIGDMAQEHGVAMAMHFAGTPICFMANLHCAAATENFVALEHHSVDVPWWEDMVTGVPKPLYTNGFANIPTGPGLGFDVVLDVVKEHLREPGLFEPTDEWNEARSHDRLWS